MTECKDFRSKVEDLVEVKELKFPPSAGFGGLHRFFSEGSVSHPAKANLYLLRYLIEKYTKEGDVVSDPMAGTGSTGIVASYLGRHSVLVELEEKFVSWIIENVKLLEKHGGKKGEIKVLQGDTRKLTELLGVKADSIVTSPPDSSGGWKADENPSNPIRREKERKLLYPMRPPDPGRYSENRENIGNLPLGNVDTIVTSPPYSDSRKSTKLSEKDLERKIQILEKGAEEGVYHSGGKSYRTPGRLRWLRGWMGEGFPKNKQNIANLPHGDVDAIITSPPYSEALSAKAGGGSLKNAEGEGLVSDGEPQAQGAPKPYSADSDEAQIGNLRHGDIDAIFTVHHTQTPSQNRAEGEGRKNRRFMQNRKRILRQS